MTPGPLRDYFLLVNSLLQLITCAPGSEFPPGEASPAVFSYRILFSVLFFEAES